MGLSDLQHSIAPKLQCKRLTSQSSAADPLDPYARRFARVPACGRLCWSGKHFPAKKYVATV